MPVDRPARERRLCFATLRTCLSTFAARYGDHRTQWSAQWLRRPCGYFDVCRWTAGRGDCGLRDRHLRHGGPFLMLRS